MSGGVADSRLAEFDEVYRRELVAVSAVAIALTGDREAGIDLAHEAMLRAYREWERVGRLDRPGAWIRRVVINLARDVHRRRVRETRAMRRLGPAANSELIASDHAFWEVVAELPDRQREVVVLRYVDDLTVAEIADVLDVGAGTVKTSLFRARKTLASRLGAEEVRDDDDR